MNVLSLDRSAGLFCEWTVTTHKTRTAHTCADCATSIAAGTRGLFHRKTTVVGQRFPKSEYLCETCGYRVDARGNR